MQRGILPLSRLLRPCSAYRSAASSRNPCTVQAVSRNATRFPAASRAPFRMASSAGPGQPAPIRFSEGEDTQQVTTGLNSLRQRGWQLDGDGMGLTKTYYFKTYFKAVSFVNVIAAESAAKKHHPTMTVRIGSVDVHWTTHQPRGLSLKDVTLAEHCEDGAELVGAVDGGQGKKCY